MTDYIMPENMRIVLNIAKTLHSTHGAVWFDPWAFTDMTTMSWEEINHWVDELLLGYYLEWNSFGLMTGAGGARITGVGLVYLEGSQS